MNQLIFNDFNLYLKPDSENTGMKQLKISAYLFIITLLIGCGQSAPQTDNLFQFKEYITQTTSGRQSIASPIMVQLTSDVEAWEVNGSLDASLISIVPSVKGTVTAHNKRTLVFQPAQNLAPNTEYTVTLALGKILEVPKEFKTYSFAFQTIEPNFSIRTNNIRSYSKEWQYLEGSLSSADVLTKSDVNKILKAQQKGKSLSVKWEELNPQEYTFIVDSITRHEQDSEIELSWTGKHINIENEGQSKILIPGKSNFTIIKYDVSQHPDQHLILNFSDPIKKGQNFKGLVTIEGASSLKYVVDGNVLSVYPAERLTGNAVVTIFQGIESFDGYKFKKTREEIVAFEQLKPAVRLLKSGVILPNSENLKFNFEAVNLSSVDVRVIKIYENNILQFLQNNSLNSQGSIKSVGRRVAKKTIELIPNPSSNTGKWKTYALDLKDLIKADPGAIYRLEFSFKKAYSLYDCSVEGAGETRGEDEDYDDYYYDDYYEDYSDYNEELSEDEEEREEQYWDNVIYSYRNNYYSWRDRDNPCKDGYYYNEDNYTTANILASNIGLIAKKGANKSYYFVVTDLLTAKPISGAKVKLYNYQQQVIETLTTNGEGVAIYDGKKHISFVLAEQNKSKTYLKLADGEALSLSSFNVSGKQLEKGLKGYIYGERGVWRPGDNIHLTFVLNDKQNPLPENHPVKLRLTDVNGQVTYQKITTDHVGGFYQFTIPTEQDNPTGNWSAVVSVGGATFYKNVKVETIKPNRLKLAIDFDKEVLSANDYIRGKLSAKWLHGAIAKNLDAEINVSFTSTSEGFEKFPDYIFNDPIQNFYSDESAFFSGKLNEFGEVSFSKNVELNSKAPGLLKASFLTKVYEQGGSFSLDVITKKYAPFSSFVGIKKPESKSYGSYYTDENISFQLATADADGNPIVRQNLEIEIYKIEWRWWWNSSSDNLSQYVGSRHHKPFKSMVVSTNSKGQASFKVNVPEDEGGRYLIRVKDPVSNHATGITTYFYRNWWRSNSDQNQETASMLVFTADKDDYKVGETAKLTFPSSSTGNALVSIENGSRVLSTKWVKTLKGETTFEIPITEEMAPNVFINISLLQPHSSTANDLPLRLYGVIPLLVENPETKLYPIIKMKKELQPEKEFEVTVSEKSGKAMTYTIAVVDEGLLDLTRFKTPNAWDEFYKREALGVTTWDVFDDVIGAYSGSVDQVFGIGGDGDLGKNKAKKADRFKPVALVMGPFKLAKGGSQTTKFMMPKYVGSVRTMVVVGNRDSEAYGNAEETTPVKTPLMVLASLPRKLSPGEKVTLPVTVFAMDKKIKNAKISLKLSKGIRIVGEQTQTISFSQPDEKMVYFELDVSDAEGIAKVEVIATGSGEQSSFEVEIDVENTNPISSVFKDLVLEGAGEKTIDFTTFGVSGSNKAELELSTLPPMNFTKRLQFLIQYPHGCLEQTTSGVFPQLFLADIFDITIQEKQKIQKNVQAGIDRIGKFQTTDGGMGYWMGDRDANDWSTSYAGHFLLEAEKKGYSLPLTFKNNWIQYQQKEARAWRPSYQHYNSDLAQSYRLYTLALAGKPDLSAMNRLKEFTEISNEAKWRLAATYALAGQNEAASQLAKSANIHFKSLEYNYYTYGSVDRNRAMALETMVLTNDKKKRELAEYIARDLSSDRWMSTQTTAYSLLAMAKMVEKAGGKAIHISYETNGQKPKIENTKNAILMRRLDIVNGKNKLTINNLKDNTIYARVITSGILPLGEELTASRGLVVDVSFEDTEGNRINIGELAQGTSLVATVTVSNLKYEYLRNVALTQTFPSGWEIINTRFTDFSSATTADNAVTYTDIRDDKVHYYFDLGEKKSKTFKIELNASYLGTYYLPGVQAEAMYDNNFFVRSKGQWVNVVK